MNNIFILEDVSCVVFWVFFQGDKGEVGETGPQGEMVSEVKNHATSRNRKFPVIPNY